MQKITDRFRNIYKRCVSRLKTLSVGLIVVSITGSMFLNQNHLTSHAAANSDELDLRFIYTTDLHGQFDSYDYEMGTEYNVGGLSKAYTLLKETKAEIGDANTFTFDIGDSLYDFTTEYMFSEYNKEVQPIYMAMAKVGYDAITLGNHDFDYGFDYINNQLKESGLLDITVVSNVMDSKTGEHIWKENMMITRTVKAKDGSKVQVKIGVIGETIPVLSKKTEDYSGYLKTEDIIENVETQANNLKLDGADIVVVLSHSGMGEQEPDIKYKNVSYELSLIDSVDVILCGHEHTKFPTEDMTSVYYNLPGVSKETGLVNGKNLLLSYDRGRSIGVADLTLKKNGSTYDIIKRSSQVRVVDKTKTAADKVITSAYGNWASILSEYTNKVIATLAGNVQLTNYFGLVEDNPVMQILNDAKRDYAIRYVNTTNTKYKDYPVIAVSNYNRYGQNSPSDYVNLTGGITEAMLGTVQQYNKYLGIYTLTGKQLKEWLEWTASAYETIGSNSTWKDATVSSLIQEKGIYPLVKEDWYNTWNNYYVFDGIEYTINPHIAPRYDSSGNKISNTNRITSFTYNGEAISDSKVFVLASDMLTKTTEATKNLDLQYIIKGYNRSQAVLADYIEQLGKIGTIKERVDHNWRLELNSNQKFIVPASNLSDKIATKQKWYMSTLSKVTDYRYYIGHGTYTTEDNIGPSVIAVPLITQITNQDITVIVHANDTSGIKLMKYTSGNYDVNDKKWDSTASMTGGTFKVTTNGVYSILAEDKKGNKSVTKIMIDNINKGALQAPTVNTYTNRKTKITGKAEPNSTIYFETETKTYNSKVGVNGEFSYALESQIPGSKLYVYVKDTLGRESGKKLVPIKSTGPNSPTINTVSNKTAKINGKTNSKNVSLYAIIDNTVYVSKKDGEEDYQDSEKYNENLEVVTTTIKIEEDGTFNIDIPIQIPGVKISVYAQDHLGRVSRVRNMNVNEMGPNAPVIYNISSIERMIYGTVNMDLGNSKSNKSDGYDITVTIDDVDYEGKTDENGDFMIPVNKLTVGQLVKVYATDYVDGSLRTSYVSSSVVKDISKFYSPKESAITIYEVTDKMTSIAGEYDEPDQTIYISMKGNLYQALTDENGYFELELDQYAEPDANIYFLTRYTDGNIIETNKATVIRTIPEKPYIEDAITNNTKEIEVVTDKDSTITVMVGKKKYTASKYTYNEEEGIYTYKVTITRTNSGETVKVYATNKAGKSKTLTTTIEKTAPDSPTVKTIDTKSEKIIGKVEIVILDESTSTDTSTFKDTTVFAQIGKKTYSAIADSKGNFTIEIPKQKKNTEITLWGTNASGRGPQTKVKVVEAKKEVNKEVA